MKYLGLVKATSRGETIPKGRSISRPRLLGRSLLYRKWLNRLFQKAERNFFAVQAITFRPFVWVVISSEDFIDPRKVDGKVLIDTLFLRRMVPMMIPGHDQILFEPFRIGTIRRKKRVSIRTLPSTFRGSIKSSDIITTQTNGRNVMAWTAKKFRSAFWNRRLSHLR